MAHLVAALQPLAPGAGRATLGLLRLPGAACAPPPWGGPGRGAGGRLARRTRRWWCWTTSRRCADPGVADLLDALLRHPPPALRLVLATRVDPPLPLARLRARGQLAGAARRRPALHRRRGRGLPRPRRSPRRPSPAAAARLTARTEGWAAGLRLAAARPAPGPPPRAAVAAAPSARRRQAAGAGVPAGRGARPPAPGGAGLPAADGGARAFCAPLCDALLAPAPDGAPPPRAPGAGPPGAGLGAAGGRGAGRALPHARSTSRAPARLAPAPAAGGDRPARRRRSAWYRYHPLFRDLLLQQLRARRGPGAVLALHARAGAWFGAAGLVEEGLHHLLAAGDAAGAGRWWRRHAHPALERGRRGRRWSAGWTCCPRPGAPAPGRWAWPGPGWRTAARGTEALPALLAAARALLDGSARPARRPSGVALEGAAGRPDRRRALPRRRPGGDAAPPPRRALARLPATLPTTPAGRWPVYAALGGLAAEGVDARRRRPLAGRAPGGARGRDEPAPWQGARRPGLRPAAGAGGARRRSAPGRALLELGEAAGLHFGRLWGHVLLGAVRYEWDRLRRGGAALRGGAGGARRWPRSSCCARPPSGWPWRSRPRAALRRPTRRSTALADALLTTANTRQLAALDAFRARLALLRGDPAAGAAPAAAERRRPAPHCCTPAGCPAPDAGLGRPRPRRPAPAAGAADLAAAGAELDALLADSRAPAPGPAPGAGAGPAGAGSGRAGPGGRGAGRPGGGPSPWAQPGGLRRTFLDLGPPLARLLGHLAARRPPGSISSGSSPPRRGAASLLPGTGARRGRSPGATWWSR